MVLRRALSSLLHLLFISYRFHHAHCWTPVSVCSSFIEPQLDTGLLPVLQSSSLSRPDKSACDRPCEVRKQQNSIA